MKANQFQNEFDLTFIYMLQYFKVWLNYLHILTWWHLFWLSLMFCFVFLVQNSIDNDQEAEHGSASKKRKTASVIVDQPAESDKMVVDQVTDVMATFEEVCYCIVPEQCCSVGKLFLNFDYF